MIGSFDQTAVALDAAESPLAATRIRACAGQLEQLLSWSTSFPERLWAIEGADGLGHLFAQQLPGRAYYDRKIAEGATGTTALRSLKRRISDAIYNHLRADAQRASAAGGPGRATGERLIVSVTGSHPERRLFDQATPEPAARLEPATATTSRTKRARPTTA